jgi:hypothetical protein
MPLIPFKAKGYCSGNFRHTHPPSDDHTCISPASLNISAVKAHCLSFPVFIHKHHHCPSPYSPSSNLLYSPFHLPLTFLYKKSTVLRHTNPFINKTISPSSLKDFTFATHTFTYNANCTSATNQHNELFVWRRSIPTFNGTTILRDDDGCQHGQSPHRNRESRRTNITIRRHCAISNCIGTRHRRHKLPKQSILSSSRRCPHLLLYQ